MIVQYLSDLNWEIVKLLGEISHTRCLDVDSASTKYHSNVININSRVNLGFRARRDSVRSRVWEITLRILSFRKSEPRRSHLTVMNHLRVRSLSVPFPLSACLLARDIKRRYILRRFLSQTSRSHINKISAVTLACARRLIIPWKPGGPGETRIGLINK